MRILLEVYDRRVSIVPAVYSCNSLEGDDSGAWKAEVTFAVVWQLEFQLCAKELCA